MGLFFFSLRGIQVVYVISESFSLTKLGVVIFHSVLGILS